MRNPIACAVIALASAALCAQPIVFLNDGFNGENGGLPATDYSDFALWTLTRGSVDLRGPEDGRMPASQGLFVDLGGSEMRAGRMESRRVFPIVPGTYELRFAMAGSQQAGGSNQVNITLGPFLNLGFRLASEDTLQILSFEFTVMSSGSARLVFDHVEGNVAGLLLDDVRLTRILPPPCRGDANFSGGIDFTDATSVLENWGLSYPGATGFGDADADGQVDFADITAVMENWGLGCE